MSEPSDNDLSHIWQEDVLGRKELCELYSAYLINQYNALPNKHFVLNIDSAWGGGKTFFIERWAETLKSRNHPCIVYDAWSNDYTRDPMLSLLAKVLQGLAELLPKGDSNFQQKLSKTKDLAKRVLLKSAPVTIPALTTALMGIPIPNVFGSPEENANNGGDTDTETNSERLTGDLSRLAVENLLEKENSRDVAIEQFKTSISDLISEIQEDYELPLFIFIDELDRCRPDFSIDLIECVKHIFNIEDVFFIFGTDGRQLQASINARYGNNFDAEIYFKRIFNRELQLPEPKNENFILMLFTRNGLDHISADIFSIPNQLLCQNTQNTPKLVYVISKLSSHFDMKLREIEQCFNCLSTIVLARSTPVHVCYLYFLIVLWHRSKSTFNDYVNSDNKFQLADEELDRVLKCSRLEFIEFTQRNSFTHAPSPNRGRIYIRDFYHLYITYHDMTLGGFSETSYPSDNQLREQVYSFFQTEYIQLHRNQNRDFHFDIRTYPKLVSELS